MFNKFSIAQPGIDIRRSIFSRNSEHKTTFNAGKLIPLYIDEVLPGDTRKIDLSCVVREMTPICPVMDNSFFDTFAFFVPMRLVWSSTKNFFGENTDSYWYSQTEKTIPQILINDEENPIQVGSLADYLGIPTDRILNGLHVNQLPFRAYGLIWNEYFRDQNCQAPVNVPLDDSGRYYNNYDSSDLNSFIAGKAILPVNKYHDYFTSCLPSPQKGDSVTIPLGDKANVIASDSLHASGAISFGSPGNLDSFTLGQNSGRLSTSGGLYSGENYNITQTNLVADLSNATAASINNLRLAFAFQRLRERDARSGTRFREYLKSHFGVSIADARVQVPEFLGGKHIPLNMNQVLQTSQTSTNSILGQTGAFSITTDQQYLCTKSFDEPGYIFILGCVRTDHTYQQGIERLWSRVRLYDFYDPALAHIGEQAVLNKEIFVQGGSNLGQNNEVFGYQEAWAEYRYKPSRTSGYMRSSVNGSLDIWHYGDDFSVKPVLNSDFMKETEVNINRTLAVPSDSTHQFLADFYIQDVATRPMPVYSVPGFMDHF